MPRKGKRQTIAKGIYRDGKDGPYEVRVIVGGEAYSERMPADSTLAELKTKRAQLESTGRTETPRATKGTLRAGVTAYTPLIIHLSKVTQADRKRHLAAWCEYFGNIQRHRLTDADVLAFRAELKARGLANKTINDHVGTLRNLYHRLDGKRKPTPCDDIDPLPVAKTPIERVSDALILAVDQQLQARERDRSKTFDGAKTRARFRVFVSTGKRPCEIMRAQPSDVNIAARVWVPRDAKGGFCPGVYLNDDQLEAWKLFIEADAWGKYNHGSFARTIRKAGWPDNVRPYQARHTTWITASELGVDLGDIAAGAGHTDLRMTRRMYVPVLNSRLQRMSEALDGRFQGWPVVPIPATGEKSSTEKG